MSQPPRTGALQVPGKLLPQGRHQAMHKIFGVGVGVGVCVCVCVCVWVYRCME